MAKLKVTQRRSVIDRPRDQKDTVRRLGLKRINDSVVKDDRPEIRGMIRRHWYLLCGSWPRVLELAYWPTVQMVLWGFITKFLAGHTDRETRPLEMRKLRMLLETLL